MCNAPLRIYILLQILPQSEEKQDPLKILPQGIAMKTHSYNIGIALAEEKNSQEELNRPRKVHVRMRNNANVMRQRFLPYLIEELIH